MPQYLSKSDYKLARDCPAKLYYKKLHYPSSNDNNPFMELLEEGGYLFEALAKLNYPDGVAIDESLSLEESAATTRVALLADQVTLFEATFISAGKLVRVDILVKDGAVLNLIEVKSKGWSPAESFRGRNGLSGEWLPYLEDVAFQALVLRECYPELEIRSFLLLPDTTQPVRIEQIRTWFRFEEIGREGEWVRRMVAVTGDVALLRQESIVSLVPVDAEVAELLPQVAAASARFVASLNPLVRLAPPLGHRCGQCEYRLDGSAERNGFVECWRGLAHDGPHLLDLYFVGTTSLVGEMLEQGRTHLFDVPLERLRNKDGSIGKRSRRQLIQIEHTRLEREWFSDELAGELGRLEYPLHFLDFETARFVLPSHASLTPYALEAFQWSCHTLRAPGAELEHAEWINTEPSFPNERFARSLMEHLGDGGTVLAWATHESTTLRQIADQLAARGWGDDDLHSWLRAMAAKGRIVDMNAMTVNHYFHPAMRGQTSLKVVADAIWRSAPALRQRFAGLLGLPVEGVQSLYKALAYQPVGAQQFSVQNGTEALHAYERMVQVAALGDAEFQAWRQLLLQYCRLDTLAMVLVWEHWRAAVLGEG